MQEENHHFLDSTPEKKEELKKKNFYDQLQDILNKMNKNDYAFSKVRNFCLGGGGGHCNYSPRGPKNLTTPMVLSYLKMVDLSPR